MMKLFLGIDGGGTKTKVVIIDQNSDIIFENTSGPSSIDTVDNFTTINNIRLAIQPFIDKFPDTYFHGVFAGIGGIVFNEDCEMVEKLLRQLKETDDSSFIRARNDMYNALYSSDNFDSGMALICGTGMVAFGINDDMFHKAGGWGYKEGELGSGFHLGCEAIRHLIRAYDNRHDLDDFALELGKKLDFKEATDIISLMDNIYGDRTKIASLAPVVTKHANLDNKYAKAICDLATDELALAIEAVYKKLGFKSVTLVIVGSLGNAKGYFNDSLISKINKINSLIKVTAPVIDPALAAAKAAKHFCEV